MEGQLEPIQIKITASGAEEAVKSIHSVTKSLKELQKVSKSMTNVMSNFGNTINKNYDKKTIYKGDVITNKNYNRTLNKTINNTKNYSKELKEATKHSAKLFVNLYSLQKASKYLSDAFDESASWVENLNVMEVAFGKLSDNAYKFTQSVAKSFGLDANQILEYVSLFQQMASAMGQSTETAYMMSTALTLLGTDVASLYNKDVKTTMEALRSAIAGQVKPVRQFGFDITSYSIDALIEEMGILEGYTSRMMTQSQKQLARTILLIKQSKNAWGDLGKTINTYSNQQKILSSQFINLKRAIGDLFIGTDENIGIATKTLYVINGVMMSIVETIRAFIPEASSSGFNEVQKDADNTKDSIEDLEEATSGALLSFDKFNTLSDSKGTGQNWITGELENKLMEEYNNYMKQWNERMENIQSISHNIRDNIMSFLGFTKQTVTTTDELGHKLTTVKFVLSDGVNLVKVVMPLVKALVSLSLAKSVISLTKGLKGLFTSMALVNGSLAKTNNILSGGILFGVFMLIDAIKSGDKALTIFASTITTITTGLFLFKNGLTIVNNIKMLGEAVFVVIKHFREFSVLILRLTKYTWGATASFVAFGGAIALFTFMDKLNDNMKIIVGTLSTLTSALFIGAAAWATFHGAMSLGTTVPLILGSIALGVAGITSVSKGIKGKIGAFANGGYPDEGNMFIANENGAELVGNIGGRTAVANNDMIVQAIENASYRGMMSALSTTNGNNINIKINANSNDLSRALAKSMVAEFQRQGYRI